MLLRKLSIYEKKPEKFDHESLLHDMEREAEKMKRDLGVMGQAISKSVPFYSDVTNNTNQPQNLPLFESQNTILANCDVRGYRPDELAVKAIGSNLVEVSAEHHEKNCQEESHRKFVRHFQLPDGVSINDICPNLTPEGTLIVSAPRLQYTSQATCQLH